MGKNFTHLRFFLCFTHDVLLYRTSGALKLNRPTASVILASSTTCFSAVPKDLFWTYAAGLMSQKQSCSIATHFTSPPSPP